MENLILSNTIKGFSNSITASSWNQIYTLLCNLKDKGGTINLSISNNIKMEPDCLEVRSERGLYLVTLLYNLNKNEDEVKTLVNGGIDHDEPMIEILGDFWSTDMITQDFDMIVSIFKEFFETGNVSETFLY